MTVQCEEFEYCKVKVNFTADEELVQEKKEDVLETLKKMNLKVPGFRQNMRPSNAKRKKKKNKSGKKSSFKNTLAYERQLKKTYADYIKEQVQKELVAEAYDETLYETKMKPVGYPRVVSSNLEDDSFNCELIFLKKPEFELGQYKGWNIPAPHQKDDQVLRSEQMLESLRHRHADVEMYGEDDFLQEGDNVSLDIECYINGEMVESFTKQGLPYFVGRGTFEEFDHALYGMKVGEEREFDIAFKDEENINEELRGKTVHFKATLNAGTKSIPAELNDELAKKLGYKSINELQNEALGTASAQIDKEIKDLVSQQVLKRLLAEHDFEVPTDFILMESQNSARAIGTDFKDLTDEEKQRLNEQSTEKIKLSLILDSIRDEEPEAVFSEMEIINTIKANITANGGNPDEVLSRAQADGTLFGLVARLKDEATIQWLVEQSNIIDETVNTEKEDTDGEEEE